jgi:hypothetical protein
LNTCFHGKSLGCEDAITPGPASWFVSTSAINLTYLRPCDEMITPIEILEGILSSGDSGLEMVPPLGLDGICIRGRG